MSFFRKLINKYLGFCAHIVKFFFLLAEQRQTLWNIMAKGKRSRTAASENFRKIGLICKWKAKCSTWDTRVWVPFKNFLYSNATLCKNIKITCLVFRLLFYYFPWKSRRDNVLRYRIIKQNFYRKFLTKVFESLRNTTNTRNRFFQFIY